MIGSLLRSIRNAGNMVNVNKKNYVFLSVTIIISFSALGIYMFYSDSSIFNEHKEILNVSSKVAFIEYENKEVWVKNLLEEIETDNVQRIANIILAQVRKLKD